MKKLLTITVAACCLMFATLTFASSQTVESAVDTAGQAVETPAKEMMYKGIIQLTNKGAELITLEKKYQLDGGDFSALAGQKVTVFGELVQEGEQEKIIVSKLAPVKQ